jgi:Holliday junction resolvase-like predicted endonuclease
LVDAGNTVTLAHYLRLLEGAGMVAGLEKFSGNQIRQRGSSPKLPVLNTALMTAQSGRDLPAWLGDGDTWGRLVESAVGAHLVNSSAGCGIEIGYWRERNHEVDFTLRRGDALVAIEVKSGARRQALPGIAAFEMRTARPPGSWSAAKAFQSRNSSRPRLPTGLPNRAEPRSSQPAMAKLPPQPQAGQQAPAPT